MRRMLAEIIGTETEYIGTTRSRVVNFYLHTLVKGRRFFSYKMSSKMEDLTALEKIASAEHSIMNEISTTSADNRKEVYLHFKGNILKKVTSITEGNEKVLNVVARAAR